MIIKFLNLFLFANCNFLFLLQNLLGSLMATLNINLLKLEKVLRLYKRDQPFFFKLLVFILCILLYTLCPRANITQYHKFDGGLSTLYSSSTLSFSCPLLLRVARNPLIPTHSYSHPHTLLAFPFSKLLAHPLEVSRCLSPQSFYPTTPLVHNLRF